MGEDDFFSRPYHDPETTDMNSAAVPPPLVKGASLLGFFKYVKSAAGGERRLEKVLAALPPETAAQCRRKVIAVAEYPYQMFVDLIRTIDRVLGRGDLEVCRRLGEFAAGKDVQAFFLPGGWKEVKPLDVFRSAGLLWKSYHINSGEMKILEPEPGLAVIRIENFPGMDVAHCRLLEGYFSQGLKEMGGVWVQELREVKCSSRGDAVHEFTGRWRMSG